MYSTFQYESADGTAIQGWTNDGEGPAIIVCNGLGVPPEAWPRLIDPGCGYRVYGFNHRGTFGSNKPTDPEAIRIDDHVADALALMDEVGVEEAIFVAWSYGVNVSFEIARRAPERVAGMVMCAGLPGGTAHSAFAPMMVPRPLRRPLGMALARAGEIFGPELGAFAKLLPKTKMTADVMRNTGLIMRSARSEDIIPWLDAFAQHDFSWYFHMFGPAVEHEAMDLAFVDPHCPVTVAAGGLDTLTSMLDIVEATRKIAHAQIHVLHGTHFIPLEFPDQVMSMIDGVLLRSRLASEQVVEARTAVIDIRTYDGQEFYEHLASPGGSHQHDDSAKDEAS